jgi:hypothetical protein
MDDFDKQTLGDLAGSLFRAKKDEETAKQSRIKIEEALASKIEGPEIGSTTIDTGEGIKVTVKRGFNYKADVAAIRDLEMSDELVPIEFIPSCFAFDESKYEALRSSNPQQFAKVAPFVTVTPKKVSVSLKI